MVVASVRQLLFQSFFSDADFQKMFRDHIPERYTGYLVKLHRQLSNVRLLSLARITISHYNDLNLLLWCPPPSRTLSPPDE